MSSESIRFLTIALLLFLLTGRNSVEAQSYDFLLSATAVDTAVTPGNGSAADVVSVTLDLGITTANVSKVLVMAAMNMEGTGANTGDREVEYEIYNDGDAAVSGIIQRQIQKNDDFDYGIGTQVHIFDASSLSGNVTYTFEHKNNISGGDRDVESIVYLTGIALTTDIYDNDLYSSNKRIGSTGVTTTSATFAGVSGLVSDAVTLPLKGDIYAAASINGSKNTGSSTVGEWILQYQVSGGSGWTNIGYPIQRTMSNNADEGIISLVGMARDLDADDYIIRVAHRRVSGTGTVKTLQSNMVAVSLSHDGGGYFPSFYQVLDQDSSIVDQGSSGEVASSEFISAADISSVGPNLLVHTQYLSSATDLDGSEKLLAKHQLLLDNGTTIQESVAFRRLLASNNDYGSGGSIGLATDLDASTDHTIIFKQFIDSIYVLTGDADTLNTSKVVLTGFQTYDQPTYVWDGSSSSDWNTAANWAENQVPVSSGYAVIPDIATEPTISTSKSLSRLSIAAGSQLVIDSIGDLTVDGEIFNSDTIAIKAGKTSSGSLIVKGEANGVLSMDSYLTADEWHIVAAPVDSQAFTPFLANTLNSIPDKSGSYGLTHYVESTNSWGTYYTSATVGNFTPGQGYLMRRATKDSVVNYAGDLVLKDVSVDLTSVSLGWNALGNPYTSAIGATSGASSTANFLTQNLAQLDPNYSALYLWDEQTGYDGSQRNYRVIGNAGYSDVLNYTELNLDNLQAGQGFLVKSKSGGATVSFTQDMQVHEKTESLLKSAKTSWDGFQIHLKSRSTQTSTIVTFNETMTYGLDQSYDAGLLGANANFMISSRLLEDDQGLDFKIQCLPDLMYTDMIIPLHVGLHADSTAIISAAGIILPEGFQLILEDRENEKFVDLLLEDSEYHILENNPIQGTGRFYIHLLAPESISDIKDRIEEDAFEAYYFNETIRVRNKQDSKATAMLFDLNGRLIGRYQLYDNVNDIPVPGLKERIYILTVSDNKSLKSFKIPVF